MAISSEQALPGDGAADPGLKELVMGLHWSPPDPGLRGRHEPPNLDAVCVLLDSGGDVLERIQPDHPRNRNDSVLHTGDSRTGASPWDDERIFVFLDALPQAVASVLFGVVSADGRSLSTVPGASCHVSDHAHERELVRIRLDDAAGDCARAVAIAVRAPSGWAVARAGREAVRLLAPELRSQPQT
jgi:tellurium resistance protein TerZ